MNLFCRRPAFRSPLPVGLGLVAGLACALLASAQPASPGVIRGRVLSPDTGNYLEGAAVGLGGTGFATLTTRSGEFELSGVPPGTHELTVSYAGLDTQTLRIEVPPGGQVERLVQLTSGIYRLAAIEVVGIREGNAAAITAQRNAPNVANIISTDAYGNIADGNIGNFLQRLPGVDQAKSNGDIQGFSVRGMAQALSTVSLDGTGLAAANGGSSPVGDRAFPIDNLPSDLIASVKLTKAPTPDVPADSLVVNAGFTYKARRFLGRVFYNYASGYLAAQNADPTLRTYGTEDKTVDVNLQYRVRPWLSLFADVNNLFNYSPGTYIISKNYVLTDEYNGPRINVGVSGRF